MDHLTYAKRLNYLLELVEKGNLSSPQQVANQFECSEKTVRNMINDLRSMGHPVKYCRSRYQYFLA